MLFQAMNFPTFFECIWCNLLYIFVISYFPIHFDFSNIFHASEVNFNLQNSGQIVFSKIELWGCPPANWKLGEEENAFFLFLFLSFPVGVLHVWLGVGKFLGTNQSKFTSSLPTFGVNKFLGTLFMALNWRLTEWLMEKVIKYAGIQLYPMLNGMWN